jgi:hypothetical protein
MGFLDKVRGLFKRNAATTLKADRDAAVAALRKKLTKSRKAMRNAKPEATKLLRNAQEGRDRIAVEKEVAAFKSHLEDVDAKALAALKAAQSKERRGVTMTSNPLHSRIASFAPIKREKGRLNLLSRPSAMKGTRSKSKGPLKWRDVNAGLPLGNVLTISKEGKSNTNFSNVVARTRTRLGTNAAAAARAVRHSRKARGYSVPNSPKANAEPKAAAENNLQKKREALEARMAAAAPKSHGYAKAAEMLSKAALPASVMAAMQKHEAAVAAAKSKASPTSKEGAEAEKFLKHWSGP